MAIHPIIETPRLILRPLRSGDAGQFLALAGEWTVARMTSDIPHPLLPEHAKDWLKPSYGDVRFAIELQGTMIGSAGFFRRRSGAAELGFWLGCESWGFGFATEAASAVVRHGFSIGYNEFSSSYFADNSASGKVLAKLGFEPVGSGRIWCVARGQDVNTIGVWLTRERATAMLGDMPATDGGEARWSGRLGRWLGAS